jgi:hypothetical protein
MVKGTRFQSGAAFECLRCVVLIGEGGTRSPSALLTQNAAGTFFREGARNQILLRLNVLAASHENGCASGAFPLSNALGNRVPPLPEARLLIGFAVRNRHWSFRGRGRGRGGVPRANFSFRYCGRSRVTLCKALLLFFARGNALAHVLFVRALLFFSLRIMGTSRDARRQNKD